MAGYFYPGGERELREVLGRMMGPSRPKAKALAVVAPHAGYQYSGPVAGAVFSTVLIPGTCLMLGPAHRPIGSLFAVQSKGSWSTPLGDALIAEELAGRILEECPLVEEDERAHLEEHSIEVQLPFLQYFRPEVSLVPICVSHEAEFGELAALGTDLARVVKSFGKEVLVVTSTDMSHYVDQKTALLKDGLAIEKILSLDAKGLFDIVRSERISMCGYQPTAAAIVLAKGLDAEKAELVEYRTSGDETGDYSQVVGYAGFRVI